MSSAERLFAHDAATGMSTWFSASDDGNDWTLRYEQETAPIINANKAAQADQHGRLGDMAHVASIPNVVLMEWVAKHGVRYWDKNHQAGVRRLLNSSDYRYLLRRPITL